MIVLEYTLDTHWIHIGVHIAVHIGVHIGVHMEYCTLNGFLVVWMIQGREGILWCDYVDSVMIL